MASQEVNEYDTINLTYAQNGVVSSVVASEYVPGVIFGFVGTNTTVSGKTSDVFDRVIAYINDDGLHRVITKFSDLPSSFETIYSYTAPSAQFKTITISTAYIENITLIPKIAVDELIIRYNWATSNAALSSAVLNSKY